MEPKDVNAVSPPHQLGVAINFPSLELEAAKDCYLSDISFSGGFDVCPSLQVRLVLDIYLV